MARSALETKQAIRAVLETFTHTPKAHVQSFGCQLNFSDGEKYKGILQDLGYELTDTPEDADVILFNACAVRAHAESRVIGRLGTLKPIWERNPLAVIGLCGCMAEEEEVRALLRKSYPYVKLILGAGAMETLPEKLLAVYQGEAHSEALAFSGLPDETLPTVREDGIQAKVPIMYGCNNFCTYCIVPYVRGRERSRSPEAIEAEVRALVAAGYREILLLGQNVNSYGKELTEGINFPALLRRLDAIEGDYWIRFMSSHPKDATRELIDTMLDSEHIEHRLHLPLQCGSNRVLKEMNRRYTVEEYLELVAYAYERARTRNVTFTFSSDIMVGFPTETEADFLDTLQAIERVRYNNLYTFIYSPRTGTKAADMPPVSAQEEIAERMKRLLERQHALSETLNTQYQHAVCTVLAERYDENADETVGRTRDGLIVKLPGVRGAVGTFCKAEIDRTYWWGASGKHVH